MLTVDAAANDNQLTAVASKAETITFFPLANRESTAGEPAVATILGQIAATFDLVLVDLGMLSRVDLAEFTSGDSSCYAAVLVRDLRCSNYRMVLDAREQRALLDGVDAIPWAPTCPHGRPVAVPLALAEIERRFGRR